jgi:hypothetical protein
VLEVEVEVEVEGGDAQVQTTRGAQEKRNIDTTLTLREGVADPRVSCDTCRANGETAAPNIARHVTQVKSQDECPTIRTGCVAAA